jgi:hypothetical protein
MNTRKVIQFAAGAALLLSGVFVARSAHALSFCGCAHNISGIGNNGVAWGHKNYPISGSTATWVEGSGSTMYAEWGGNAGYFAAYGIAFNSNASPICDVCDTTNDGASVDNTACSGGATFDDLAVNFCN